MNRLRLIMLLAVITTCSQSNLIAGGAGYNKHRIAISADGNNQPDVGYPNATTEDWAAAPLSLALIAKEKLQDKLVHFSYNNFIDAPAHTSETNYMKVNCEEGATRFQFDTDVFFDVSAEQADAVLSLKEEMKKSTSADPLYFILMGPPELFYLAVQAVIDDGSVEALSHVKVISHLASVESLKRRTTHHTLAEAITLSGDRITHTQIADQRQCNIGYKGFCQKDKIFQWSFLRDHRDENLKWLYKRIQEQGGDPVNVNVSDAGMVFYLLKGNETGSPNAVKNYIDYGILLEGDEIIESIDITEKDVTIFPKRRYQLNYTTTPVDPWDGFYSWTTSNSSIAYISPTGRVIGVSPGKATITLTGGINDAKTTVDVIVLAEEACESCSESCELIEKDGLLVFEAERFNLKGKWEVVEGDNYASGGKYLTYTGPNSYKTQNLANEISYTFKINNPGKYQVKWFMRQPDELHGEEVEGDKSNDVWILIDGGYGYANDDKLAGYAKIVGRSKKVFAFNGSLDIDHKSFAFYGNFPAAGEYTMKLCGRSEYVQIDRFVLYKTDVGNVGYKAADVTETTTCMDDVFSIETDYQAVTSMSIEVTDINLKVGETKEISATFEPSNATIQSITLGSSDPKVASVEGNTIKGISNGTATITVKSDDGDFTESIKVTVTEDGLGIQGILQGVFPNPAKSCINISVPNPGSLSIYSMDGRLVKTKDLTEGVNSVLVDHLYSGKYITHFKSEQGSSRALITIDR
ncbi:Ig-like domain-containing protein [Reichenbachiella versicolor]|uniref:Ig-like domain-containing protein n=1 Tax=Reichenbachiella versicolor TaxID=1821036 RepID=UPI000D6E45FE|nr:Ig-like domain-containing protein [Reichenbachiella versicolor]